MLRVTVEQVNGGYIVEVTLPWQQYNEKKIFTTQLGIKEWIDSFLPKISKV